jgi:DNA-binding NtrC family response regulator
MTLDHRSIHPTVKARRFRLVAHGATPRTWRSTARRLAVGSHAANDVAIDDETVSRFHCEVVLDEQGVRVRDLGSRNGTCIDDVLVKEAWLRHGARLTLGRVQLIFELEDDLEEVELAARERLGDLVGTSQAMRAVFALLERVARSDATVLLEGETGTGKGAAADAIHRASPRRDGPFVVVDAGALPPSLLESELFGHERGAFTGATDRRIGAFEEARGGTLFLDEIGELPLELQPKLLRVLEERTIRPLGGNAVRRIDARVIAATNRELRREVNEKRFRPDLYYRVAVARIVVPPLRERLEDLPLLVDHLLRRLGASAAERARIARPEILERLGAHAFPGNVRELRNALEQLLLFGDVTEQAGVAGPAPRAGRLPFLEARRLATLAFERAYLEELVAEFGTRTVQAAAAAELDRVYLYRLLRKHGLR